VLTSNPSTAKKQKKKEKTLETLVMNKCILLFEIATSFWSRIFWFDYEMSLVGLWVKCLVASW
jgi:hypothetical protein